MEIHSYRQPSPPPPIPPRKVRLRERLADSRFFNAAVGAVIVVAAYFIIQRVGVIVGTAVIGSPPMTWADRYVAAPIVSVLTLLVLVLVGALLVGCAQIGSAVTERWKRVDDGSDG